MVPSNDIMTDIDPSKMTDAERLTLFASFTKDLIPPKSARQTLAETVSPWLQGILADRKRGLTWDQLATVFDQRLHAKLSGRTLKRTVSELNHAADRPDGMAAAGSTRRRTKRRSATRPVAAKASALALAATATEPARQAKA